MLEASLATLRIRIPAPLRHAVAASESRTRIHELASRRPFTYTTTTGATADAKQESRLAGGRIHASVAALDRHVYRSRWRSSPRRCTPTASRTSGRSHQRRPGRRARPTDATSSRTRRSARSAAVSRAALAGDASCACHDGTSKRLSCRGSRFVVRRARRRRRRLLRASEEQLPFPRPVLRAGWRRTCQRRA